MRPGTLLLILSSVLFAAPGPISAQQNQATLEATIFGATAGYARHVAPDVLLGVELGAGVPQIDRTLSPSADETGDPDFEEYLHLAAFVRFASSERFEVDTGLRGASPRCGRARRATACRGCSAARTSSRWPAGGG